MIYQRSLCNLPLDRALPIGPLYKARLYVSSVFVVVQSAKLKKLPPFMTMSLLRFSFDFAKCERYKETGRYSFPFSINLRPFCEQVDDRFV